MSIEPTDDKWRQWMDRVPTPEPDALWASGLERRLIARAEELRRQRDRLRRSTLSRWLASGAAAAACVAIVLIGLFSGSQVTFAAVQQQIQQADSLWFETRVELIENGSAVPLGQLRSWADFKRGVRTDVSMFDQPVAQIILPSDGQPLFVDHTRRRLTPIELPPRLDPERLKQFDPASLVRRFGRIARDAHVIERLGEVSETEVGFHIAGDALSLPVASSVNLRVDRNSKLPTRVVCDVPINDRQALRFTAEHFVWQEPIDPALFELDEPNGYTPLPALEVPAPSEEAMLRTLRRCAEQSDGLFPSSDIASWRALAKNAMPSSDATAAPGGGDERRLFIAEAVAGLYHLAHLHDRGAQPRYFGTDVRLNDADRVLMHWQLPDGRTRAVYGDLRTETLEP